MTLLESLIDLFAGHGYLAVFAVLLLCGFGLPLPEDLVLAAGGVIAGLGYADPYLMCAVGVVGALAGDAIMFLAGRHFGARAARLPLVNRLLTPRRYAQVQAAFARYGSRLMFIARFLPGLRSPIYLSAGMSRSVSFARFLLLDGLAALLSVPLWVALGWYGAENHEILLRWLHHGRTALLILAAAIGALLLVWLWRRREQD